MPSVSEPFGIAALEALSHQVPVILSRTSGAAEVIQHALKVDFWDVDDLANKIVAVLRNPAIASTLRVNSAAEVARLDWTSAAHRCLEGYAAAGVT
jgi:glycosyltransferase involved in cell wall biosynthesis